MLAVRDAYFDVLLCFILNERTKNASIICKKWHSPMRFFVPSVWKKCLNFCKTAYWFLTAFYCKTCSISGWELLKEFQEKSLFCCNFSVSVKSRSNKKCCFSWLNCIKLQKCCSFVEILYYIDFFCSVLRKNRRYFLIIVIL